MAYEYVKFQRGLTETYNFKKSKNEIDSNTLYFIYDSANSATGRLYLGTRLIAGGEVSAATSLEDLSDILISNSAEGDFLVQNSEGKWVNQSVEEVASTIISSIINNTQFVFTDGVLNLKNFEEASAGAFAFKGESGNLEWKAPTADDISGLTETINSKITEAVSGLGGISYSKVNSLEEVTQENIIYLVPSQNSSTNNLYEEYLYIDGNPEFMGTFGNVSLTDYFTKAEIGNLTDLPNYTEESPTTIVQEINSINERLTWQDLT